MNYYTQSTQPTYIRGVPASAPSSGPGPCYTDPLLALEVMDDLRSKLDAFEKTSKASHLLGEKRFPTPDTTETNCYHSVPGQSFFLSTPDPPCISNGPPENCPPSRCSARSDALTSSIGVGPFAPVSNYYEIPADPAVTSPPARLYRLFPSSPLSYGPQGDEVRADAITAELPPRLVGKEAKYRLEIWWFPSSERLQILDGWTLDLLSSQRASVVNCLKRDAIPELIDEISAEGLNGCAPSGIRLWLL